MELRPSRLRWKPRGRRTFTWEQAVSLVFLLVAVLYLNQFVLPSIEVASAPTPTPTPAPEALVLQARNLFQEGRIEAAIQTYQRALLLAPEQASWHWELGRVQALVGQYEAALTSVSNALLLNPEYPEALVLRGWLLHQLDRTAEGLAHLRRGLDLDAQSALGWALYAEVLADQALYTDAGSSSRKALALDPGLLESRRARGYVLFVTGNYDEAVQEFKAALAINPYIPSLHLYLGLVYRAQGKYKEAISAFLEANALNPQDPFPDYLISRTYAGSGQFGAALQYAQTAVEEAPTDPLLRGNLGVMLYKNQKYKEAVEQLALIVKGGTSPEGYTFKKQPLTYGRVAEFYYTYGLALVRLGRCDEAVPVFREILAKVPGDEIAVFNARTGLERCGALEGEAPAAEGG